VYEPSTDDLRAIIDRLADVYAAHLREVTNLIHSQVEKQAHRFADAFRLRQEP
jgi:rubrerythrin